MADPITLFSDNVNNMVIALTDQSDLVVDATTDTTQNTDPFTRKTSSSRCGQELFIAAAKTMYVDLEINAVTGTPLVTAIVQVTRDTAALGTNAYINWLEVGRASITPASASTLPMRARIVCSPPGPGVTRLRVIYDSTGGTLDGSNKFTVNAVKFMQNGVEMAPSAIVLLG